MKNIKLTPKQMAIITNKITDAYSKIHSDDKLTQSHYEHVIIDGEMIKIGFIPGESNSRTIMEFRIVYKGGVNGK